MADEFKPTAEEIEYLKAKRIADEANKIDIDTIKPGMSKEQATKVKTKIAELWR